MTAISRMTGWSPGPTSPAGTARCATNGSKAVRARLGHGAAVSGTPKAYELFQNKGDGMFTLVLRT
jgi:hypothetical protein